MARFIETLESRVFLSATISDALSAPVADAQATVVAPVPAPAAATTTVLAQSYGGSYKIGTVKKNISFQILKAYPGGAYAASVTDAGVKYDGNVLVTAEGITINWFTYDTAMNQVAVGTIQGTFNTSGQIIGTVEKSGLTGTATLTAKPAPLADQNFTWVGTYTINGITKKIGVTLIKGYGRGIYYVNVTDGGKVFDGNMYTGTNGVTYINWFVYDANYNQIPKGSMQITAASDYNNTIAGIITKGKTTGTFIMTRPGLAPSPV